MRAVVELVYASAFVVAVCFGLYKLLCHILGTT